MPLHELASALDNQCLRGMEAHEVRFTAGFVQPSTKHAVCLRKTLAGLVEERHSFRFHKSIPSVRTPSISGVRSL